MKENNSIMDMIVTMSEGNPGAMMVVMEMLNDPAGLADIMFCDFYDIRGPKLYMLFNDCCQRNYAKFKRTLDFIGSELLTREEIHKNFKLPYALPFLDDEITNSGYPSYNEYFDLDDEKWDEYCAKNKEVFLQKLEQRWDSVKEYLDDEPTK